LEFFEIITFPEILILFPQTCLKFTDFQLNLNVKFNWKSGNLRQGWGNKIKISEKEMISKFWNKKS